MALTSSHRPFKSRIFSGWSQRRTSAIQSMKRVGCTTPGLKMEWTHSKNVAASRCREQPPVTASKETRPQSSDPKELRSADKRSGHGDGYPQPPDENLISVS